MLSQKDMFDMDGCMCLTCHTMPPGKQERYLIILLILCRILNDIDKCFSLYQILLPSFQVMTMTLLIVEKKLRVMIHLISFSSFFFLLFCYFVVLVFIKLSHLWQKRILEKGYLPDIIISVLL